MQYNSGAVQKMARGAHETEASDGTMFYRCLLCTSVISPWDIRERHGCPKCAGTKMRPSNLSLWEKLVQLAKHPAIWKWPRG